MPEVAYNDFFDEYSATRVSLDLIRSLDKNVRDLNNELYVFKSENQRDLADIKQELSTLKTSEIEHDKRIDKLQDAVSELKQEVKELRSDVSDIKGDIKAIAAGFGAAQSRFNWGLVILGIIVALIQLLK